MERFKDERVSGWTGGNVILCLHAQLSQSSEWGGWMGHNPKRVVGMRKDQRTKWTFIESLPPSGGSLPPLHTNCLLVQLHTCRLQPVNSI